MVCVLCSGNPLVKLAMPDVQNFFHKALAVVFAEVLYLYSRRKLSASFIKLIPFSSCTFNISFKKVNLPESLVKP